MRRFRLLCCRRGVLGRHLSNGIGDVGGINWPIAACLLVVFLIVYFSLWKGIKSSGKVNKSSLLHFFFCTAAVNGAAVMAVRWLLWWFISAWLLSIVCYRLTCCVLSETSVSFYLFDQHYACWLDSCKGNTKASQNNNVWLLTFFGIQSSSEVNKSSFLYFFFCTYSVCE